MPPLAYRLSQPVSTLRRSTGAVQVGLDTPVAALLADAPAGAEAAIAAFHRWSTPADVARVHDVDPRWLGRTVARLFGAGILVERSAPATSNGDVVIVGGGTVARAIARLVVAGGARNLAIWDDNAVESEPQRWPDSTDATRVRFSDHWHAALSRPADLVVVAPATVEPDRALTDHLRRSAQPHLVARVEPERAVVGPFVVPGLTPCVRCVDLTRVTLDPDWPLLLAQLARTWQRPTALATAWTASTAAAMVTGWLTRGRMPVVGATLELPMDTHALETRTWAAHPQCGCLQAW